MINYINISVISIWAYDRNLLFFYVSPKKKLKRNTGTCRGAWRLKLRERERAREMERGR